MKPSLSAYLSWKRLAISLLCILLLPRPLMAQGLVSQEPSTEIQRNFSQVELLALIELNLCGRTRPKKQVSDRLEKCEHVSGLETEITSSLPVDRRLADLLQEAPPSDDLVQYMASKEQEAGSDFYKHKLTLRNWHGTLYQLVAVLELSCYTQVDLGKSLLKRVNRLEKDILSLSAAPSNKTLAERICYLTQVIGPGDNLVDDAVTETGRRWDWLTGVAPLASSVSSNAATKLPRKPTALLSGAREGARECKSVLTSPTFLKVVGAVAGLAALGTLLVLTRNTGSSSYVTYERSCTGRSDCRKCSTCSSCGHCKTPAFVTPCGVYLRARMLSQ